MNDEFSLLVIERYQTCSIVSALHHVALYWVEFSCC